MKEEVGFEPKSSLTPQVFFVSNYTPQMADTPDSVSRSRTQRHHKVNSNNGPGPINERDRRPRAPPRSSGWVDFVEKTTIHGLRFVCKEHMSLSKKLLWILLLLMCGAMMGYQVVERVVHYRHFPITVNVNINFNRTLLFPSITICNQNSFRATKAAELKRYGLLETLYTSGAGDRNTSFLQTDHDVSGITLDDLFLSTAHTKDDFIVDCVWQREACGPENFTRVLTDHGSDHGLKLLLNAEQYECMPGPHDAAGVKILLHDEKEFPKVAELGLAVPTGTHAFVGVHMTMIENLPPPHGTCGSVWSPYYQSYTRDNCQLACLTDYMAHTCGCRHHFMPHTEGKPPVCTLRQFYGCYLKQIDRLQVKVQEDCTCPTPCSYSIYDPAISFATTSVFATERLLAAASRTSDLETKYLTALETTHRMEGLKFQEFVQKEERARNDLQTLSDLLQNVRSILLRTEKTLQRIHSQTEGVWKEKEHLYRWQAYTLYKNFMRVRDAMNERTFDVLTVGYQEFANLTESRIQLLLNPNVTSPVVRESLYSFLMTSLRAKIDLAERTMANYTELMSVYAKGLVLFQYTYLDEPEEDNQYITPKPLLKRALTRSESVKQVWTTLGENIVNFTTALQTLTDLVSAAYENRTLEPNQVHFASVNFLSRGRQYLTSKTMFDTECIDYPYYILQARIEEFERLWRTYHSTVQNSLDDIKGLEISSDKLETSVMKNFNNSMQLARSYVMGDSDVRKVDVAQELTSQIIQVGKARLEVFFHTLRTRGQSMHDNWNKIVEHTNAIWEVAINDNDTHDFYVYRNLTHFLRDAGEVTAEVTDEYNDYRQRFDIRYVVKSSDSQFLASLDDLMSDMDEYLKRTVIGTDFVRENLVQLDVFYREKHVEHITQQVAYDGFALLCDIGGSMGLFIGASLLSIGELVDLFLHQAFNRCTSRVTG